MSLRAQRGNLVQKNIPFSGMLNVKTRPLFSFTFAEMLNVKTRPLLLLFKKLLEIWHNEEHNISARLLYNARVGQQDRKSTTNIEKKGAWPLLSSAACL